MRDATMCSMILLCMKFDAATVDHDLQKEGMDITNGPNAYAIHKAVPFL